MPKKTQSQNWRRKRPRKESIERGESDEIYLVELNWRIDDLSQESPQQHRYN